LLDGRSAGDMEAGQIAKGVRMLEVSRAPDAQAILTRLAEGDAHDRIAIAAREALQRLAYKP
jgi:hypothetical protein